MPQHRGKQAGRPTFGNRSKRTQNTTESASAAESGSNPAAAWQRSQGGFSGKAKKEYLKWKRQQKEAVSDSDGGDDGSNTKHQPGSRPLTNITCSQPAPAPDRQQHNHVTPPDGSADDPTQPLEYRLLVAVPAGPCAATTSGQRADAAKASSSSDPDSSGTLQHSIVTSETANDSVIYMPCLDPAEVGFTAEGFQLDMPTRPTWQGVVNSAEGLHDLEGQQFTAWQAALLRQAGHSTGTETSAAVEAAEQQAASGVGTARAGGIGRLSFYEGRLEFWRQLWRTLEMSDIVIMIVDARNPLLHFSHALYRHITQDHKLPLLLLLNKCDLVPAAAAAAWQSWLQEQLPGVTVMPVSAAAGAADAAARQVLGAVLQQHVQRGSQTVCVQEFIGKTIDELIAESLERNMHAKRHTVQNNGRAVAAAAGGSCASYTCSTGGTAGDTSDVTDENEQLAPKNAAAALRVGTDFDDSCNSDSDEDWCMKSSKRAGTRKGNRKGSSTRDKAEHNKGRTQHFKQQLVRTAVVSGSSRQAKAVSKASQASTSEPDSVVSQGGSEISESEQDEQAEQQSALHDILAEMTLERRVLRTVDSSSELGSSIAVATAGVKDGGSSSAGEAWKQDTRPVVIGLLGEPNVGKSSTLNALLGTHRVAVSCHPGRTKHYQTHFMSSKLVLCDCPGIVFPRLDVSLPMQVLFGSYPIASCRQPYAVLRYLASASWPRLHQKLGLRPSGQQPTQHGMSQEPAHKHPQPMPNPADDMEDGVSSSSCSADDAAWSPWALCEALCKKRGWYLPKSGRPDTYRAANWMLRAALGGRQGLGLAFVPPHNS